MTKIIITLDVVDGQVGNFEVRTEDGRDPSAVMIVEASKAAEIDQVVRAINSLARTAKAKKQQRWGDDPGLAGARVG